MNWVVPIVLALALLPVEARAIDPEVPNKGVDWPEDRVGAGDTLYTSPNVYRGLVGRPVFLAGGETAGRATNFLFDAQEDEPVAVIVEADERMVAIPWASAEIAPDLNGILVRMPASELAAQPGIDPDDLAEGPYDLLVEGPLDQVIE